MKEDKETVRHLPLTEATYCILLALAEPLHGYGVMQKVEAGSDGAVRIGPGTLYGALTALEKDKLIARFDEVERRKRYILTAKGRAVLNAEMKRLRLLSRLGEKFLAAAKNAF
ncbi:MAG: PadR family transcriptional regulator [Acidobacteria bacterium]|jgi:DNA-binding PadR family transcriptional regulator|nr:PadR family transcriptional regulator [Acidobacteriota bacterium]